MGRSRRSGRHSERPDDDEEEFSTPGPSRISSTQPVSRSRRAVNPEFLSQPAEDENDDELQALENKCIQRLLMKVDTMKPFKSLDIFSGFNLKPRRQAVLLEKIKKTLVDTFGVELLQLEGKSFIVVTPKAAEIHNVHIEPTNYDIFLSVILSLIYFCRGKISEDLLLKTVMPKLFPHLSSLGCKDNVPKMLHEMESHLFIRKEVDKIADALYLLWGIRAIKEFDKKRMVPILCQLGMTQENRLPKFLLDAIENDIDFA